MLLPKVREGFIACPLRKKVLLVLLSFFIFALLLIIVEGIYCFNSLTCLLSMAKISPLISELVGIKETDLAFRKDNYSLNKQSDILSVTGEIVRIEKDRLVIKFEDGKEESFSVQEGSTFMIVDSLAEAGEEDSEQMIFEASDMQTFITPGFFLLAQVDISKGEIGSFYDSSRGRRRAPIMIFKE